MADDDEQQPQPRLVVHNTFLEFDDHAAGESATVGRRPRAQTDITETKLPRKVSYHVEEQPTQSSSGVGHSMGKLGSVPEVGQDFSGFAGSASDPMFAAAAAAAAAGLSSPFPGMPPAYFPGLSPGGAWPPWGHPQSYPPSPGMLAQSQLSGGHSPAVWPYPPMPGFPGMPSPTAAEVHSHTAFPCAGQSPIGYHSQTLQKGGGRGRGGRLQQTSPVFRSKAGQAGDGISAEPEAKAAASNANPAQPPPPPVNGTTIMLRNLPNRYSQQLLLELLDQQGFPCKYDFVYLPMDFRNGVNLGYAFVNLHTHQDALRAIEIFQGFGNWDFDSAKVCEVSWAHPHQGLAEHVERYRNSPVMHPSTPEEYKPMIFQNGIRIEFPVPTKAIRAPKLKLVPPGGGAAAAAT